MDSITRKNCDLLIKNRDNIKAAARWDHGANHWLSALLCTVEGVSMTTERIKNMRRLVKENVGITSKYRGTFALPVAAYLGTSRHSATLLKNAMAFDEALRSQGFKRSDYLLLPSLMVAKDSPRTELSSLARRSKDFYEAMREGNKLSIGQKDYSTAIILALSSLGVDEASGEAQRCYDYLQANFTRKSSVLPLSYIMSLGKERAELKCQKLIDIYDELKSQGLKYGTRYELPSLGVLAMYPGTAKEIAAATGEIAQFLLSQKGFGLFGVSKAQTLMFAGALLGASYQPQDTGEAMSLAIASVTIALVMAMETAVIASVVASSAAASSSSSN